MRKFWIVVASREHVLCGVAGGFMQVCHGKNAPLKRMKAADWILYYSPTEKFGENVPYRKFTAIGKIKKGEAYQHEMRANFVPWRRDVNFVKAKEVEIKPILDTLTFIRNKQHWGFIFRRGFFEIPQSDFKKIAEHMGVVIEEETS